jgi:translation initiation factor IF-2
MAENAQIITLPGVLSVKELAERTGKSVTEVIAALMKNGVMATINEDIDFETAAIVAADLGVEVTQEATEEPEAETVNPADDLEAVPRPPVVTVLGHVDHGKTSLLDALRETDVAAGESGGITQHIGAYQVHAKPAKGEPRLVTFLDTPGHEAFTAMRAHGTKLTDVAVLVVASDDGIKPQTVEAINHIKEADVPFVVAATKMDAPGADLNKVKQGLMEHEIVAEDWGGETVIVPTSAKTKDGLPELLEMILLVSDIAAPKANPAAPFSGVVIESRLSRAKGPVATILVQNGTLKISDYLVIEDVTGRIRLMEDFHGKRIEEAVPGTPVQVAGLSGVPAFGAQAAGAADEKSARQEAQRLMRESRARRATKPSVTAEALKHAVDQGKLKQLPVVLVADVKGSLEALEGSLNKIPQDEAKIELVKTGVGSITESDVRQAAGAGAMIVGFKARVEATAKTAAKQQKVEIATYDVIYELLEDIRKALEALLPPEIVINEIGTGEVLAIFRTTKSSQIIGCKVTDKKFVPNVSYRIGDAEATGTVGSLRRVDEEVSEVGAGTECGLTIEGPPVEVGQTITLFRRTEKAKTLTVSE